MTLLTRLVWPLVVVSAVLAVVDTLIVAVMVSLWSDESVGIHGWPFVNLASLGCSVMGALIVSTYPRQPIGWLLWVVGATTSVSLATESYTKWYFDYDGPGTATLAYASGWTSAVFGGPFAIAALTLMFLVLPDGRLLSRRWRYAFGATVLGYVVFVAGLAMEPPGVAIGQADPSLGSGTADLLITLGVLVIAVTLVLSVVCMCLRMRGAVGEARQQLRLVAVGAAAVAIGLLTVIIGQSLNGGKQTFATSVPLYVAYLLLLTCIAVAVLRYRLYNVDLIINRAVLLTLATVFVAGGYVAIVVLVGGSLGDRTEGFWPSLIATAVVAMAFQPVRRWVVRLADRLAYGDRAAPYDALAEFSREVGQSPAPDDLLPAIAEAAGRAVQAQATAVRLDLPQGSPQIRTWPPPGAHPIDVDSGADPVEIPIADGQGSLGQVKVQLGPGRDLRPAEQRLLNDIADQAALAFRNMRLEIELAGHVDALADQTAQLGASRRRIIEAADAARRRFETAISREVLPTLRQLRAELDAERPGAVEPASVGVLVDDATRALETLRELTRGIYPTLLTRAGLGPALASHYSRLSKAQHLEIDESVVGARFAARVEAAAYFCCVEVVADAVGEVIVTLAVANGSLQLDVRGQLSPSLDRQAMVDRVEVCGGTLELADGGASLRVRLPVEAEPGSAG